MNEDNLHPIRDRLSAREEKSKLLGGGRGGVYWLLGLSGSGKSTLAIEAERKLQEEGVFSIVLDGDDLRRGINRDLDFSDEGRRENIRRTSEIAKILANSGVVAIVSCITPLESFRTLAREVIGHADYHEIYVKASYEDCKKRDVKGLYAKADRNELASFTGQGSAFEEPKRPDLIIDTTLQEPEASALILASYMKKTLAEK